MTDSLDFAQDETVVEVTGLQAQQLEDLRKTFDIKLVIAFGSKVKGTSHPASDLDIGLLFNRRGLTLECLSRVSEIFPSEEVDVAFLNRADPLLLGQITAQSQLLSGDGSDFHAFRCYAFQRYADFLPYLAMEARTNGLRLETF